MKWTPETIHAWYVAAYGDLDTPRARRGAVLAACNQLGAAARASEAADDGTASQALAIEEAACVVLALAPLAGALGVPRALDEGVIKVLASSAQGRGPLEVPQKLVPEVLLARAQIELATLYSAASAPDGPSGAQGPYMTRAVAWLTLLLEELGADLWKAVQVKMELEAGGTAEEVAGVFHVKPAPPAPAVFEPAALDAAELPEIEPGEIEPLSPEGARETAAAFDLTRYRSVEIDDHGRLALPRPETLDGAVALAGRVIDDANNETYYEGIDLRAGACELGLLASVPYEPAEHGERDAEPGEEILVPTALGRYALDLAATGLPTADLHPVDVLIECLRQAHPGIALDPVRVHKWRVLVDEAIAAWKRAQPGEHHSAEVSAYGGGGQG